MELEECDCEDKDWEISEDSVEGTEEGGGRYKKSYFGFCLHATVKCCQ